MSESWSKRFTTISIRCSFTLEKKRFVPFEQRYSFWRRASNFFRKSIKDIRLFTFHTDQSPKFQHVPSTFHCIQFVSLHLKLHWWRRGSVLFRFVFLPFLNWNGKQRSSFHQWLIQTICRKEKNIHALLARQRTQSRYKCLANVHMQWWDIKSVIFNFIYSMLRETDIRPVFFTNIMN